MKLLGAVALFAPLAAALWPIPSSYSSGSTVLWIGSDVKVTYNGANDVGSVKYPNEPGLYVPHQIATNTSCTHRHLLIAMAETLPVAPHSRHR